MSAEKGNRTQQNSSKAGSWLSLMDYAMRTNLSLSTLRRYIKSKKVVYKLEGGRYFLWDEGNAVASFDAPESAVPAEAVKLKTTQTDLQKAQEEIAELKTLIAYYEERLPKNL